MGERMYSDRALLRDLWKVTDELACLSREMTDLWMDMCNARHAEQSGAQRTVDTRSGEVS